VEMVFGALEVSACSGAIMSTVDRTHQCGQWCVTVYSVLLLALRDELLIVLLKMTDPCLAFYEY
jgi:hypothetical protein